ncbi:DUF4249 family protein [candidate division KSB1 bacterium]|nr:DUF4249 family protein [candidate division KSB1 bacterium]
MNIKYALVCLICLFLINSCGDPSIVTTNESYEPKIVIDAKLVAGQPVDHIYISQNFPVTTNLQRKSVIPDVARTTVSITDIESGIVYPLSFHEAPTDDKRFQNYYWEYTGNSLKIECGKSYRLDVEAPINGKMLSASATTTVPPAGFKILNQNTYSLAYRERNENDDIEMFELDVQRSPGATFYLSVIEAQVHDVTNYIYDNPYQNIEPEDVADDADWFIYNWVQNISPEPGVTKIKYEWYNMNFYADYRVILYAVDINYQHFLQTFDGVQDDTGNYHEPIFHIEGDGIGVFGSMIADTTSFTITRN